MVRRVSNRIAGVALHRRSRHGSMLKPRRIIVKPNPGGERHRLSATAIRSPHRPLQFDEQTTNIHLYSPRTRLFGDLSKDYQYRHTEVRSGLAYEPLTRVCQHARSSSRSPHTPLCSWRRREPGTGFRSVVLGESMGTSTTPRPPTPAPPTCTLSHTHLVAPRPVPGLATNRPLADPMTRACRPAPLSPTAPSRRVGQRPPRPTRTSPLKRRRNPT